MERAAEWLLACRREEFEARMNPEKPRQQTVDLSEGARWPHCRTQHGPGLCEADCPGEFRHRPAWRPA
jgi:hypothetical protein